jgi:hypothetical protein
MFLERIFKRQQRILPWCDVTIIIRARIGKGNNVAFSLAGAAAT